MFLTFPSYVSNIRGSRLETYHGNKEGDLLILSRILEAEADKWEFIFRTQRLRDTEKKGFSYVPVTPNVVEGSHIVHTQRYLRCLDYARHDKENNSLCLRVSVFIKTAR